MPREQLISKFYCWLCDLENYVQKIGRAMEIMARFKREVVKFEKDLQKLKNLADQVRGEEGLKRNGSSADDLKLLLTSIDHFHEQYSAKYLKQGPGSCNLSEPTCGASSNRE